MRMTDAQLAAYNDYMTQLAAYNAKRGGYAPAEVAHPVSLGEFSCVIPGVPVAKGRPRHDSQGHTYTPESTRKAEAAIAAAVAAVHPAGPFLGAVRVELDFLFPTPARMPRGTVQKALQAEIRPTGRPDIDNLCKLVLDAIQGHGPGKCFSDDSQIVEIIARKWYSADPRTVLRVVAL